MHRTTGPHIARAIASIALGLAAATTSVAQPVVLPAPETVFGFPVGADRKLFTYEESIEYFRKLAAASPSVRLIEDGRTSFDRQWTAVVSSSPEKLARLDE